MLKEYPMRKLLAFITLVLLAEVSYAQSFYAIRKSRSMILVAGTGTSTYFGELANPGDYLDAKPNINAGLQYYFTPRISARAELTWFTLEGTDSKADDASRVSRNLSFKSNNLELGFTGAFNLFPNGNRYYRRPYFNAYGFGGIGLLYFNPTTEYQGQKYALQLLNT
jgi:Outer membrane protein beta-barrel domain